MSTPVEAAELVEESVGAVVVLRLNRPRRRNALTAELVDAVHHTLLRAEQNPVVRSVVLTGNGGAFGAGADIESDSSSVGDIERALRRGTDAALADQRQYEAELQPRLQKRPEFGEALQAFLDKRAPAYPPRTVTERASRTDVTTS